jgi:hypothetical protein
MSVSVFDSKDIFVSGSCDATAKQWDHRQFDKNCTKTFAGRESNINSCRSSLMVSVLAGVLALNHSHLGLCLRQRVRHGL